jgi:hypothetical protein
MSHHAIGALDRCTMAVRATVLEIMREMDATEWSTLFVALRRKMATAKSAAFFELVMVDSRGCRWRTGRKTASWSARTSGC